MVRKYMNALKKFLGFYPPPHPQKTSYSNLELISRAAVSKAHIPNA
jgi:hypothetical protein